MRSCHSCAWGSGDSSPAASRAVVVDGEAAGPEGAEGEVLVVRSFHSLLTASWSPTPMTRLPWRMIH